MRLLLISSTFPYPPSLGGTEIRTFHLLKYLQARHEVTLVTQRSPTASAAEVEALRSWVSDLVLFPILESPAAGWGSKGQRFLESLGRGIPPNVLHRYSPALQNWLDAGIQQGRWQVVTCEHGVNAVYLRPTFRASVRTVLNAHSFSYDWTLNLLKTGASDHVWRDRLYLPTLYRYERRFCRQFSRFVVTTESDRHLLQQHCPAAWVQVVPNGVDLEAFPMRQRDPGGHRLVFVGAMDSIHNTDAVRFFVNEVFPLLRSRYPDLTFSIVGNRPTEQVRALAQHPGVQVTGGVTSMAEHLHASTICVLPLRTGLGIKNKTLEATAAGVPVVGSDRALEGLPVDGENTPISALRANQIEEYIGAISRLLDDERLRSQLAQAARMLIEQHYTWEQAGQAYERVLVSE